MWDTFFPDQGHGRRCLDALKRDGYHKRQSAVRPNLRRESIHSGWTHMPDVPSKDGKLFEKEITAAFVPILNHIIATLKLSETRVAVDGQEFRIRTRDGGWLKPMCFCGARDLQHSRPWMENPSPNPAGVRGENRDRRHRIRHRSPGGNR